MFDTKRQYYYKEENFNIFLHCNPKIRKIFFGVE